MSLRKGPLWKLSRAPLRPEPARIWRKQNCCELACVILLLIELGVVAPITAVLVATILAFRPEHLEHGPGEVRLGAALQGLILGLLIGFVVLPLRLALVAPDAHLADAPPAPRGGMASLSLPPVIILMLIVRRGVLARSPLVGRVIRAYRKAAVQYQISGAQKVLAHFEGIDAGKVKN